MNNIDKIKELLKENYTEEQIIKTLNLSPLKAALLIKSAKHNLQTKESHNLHNQEYIQEELKVQKQKVAPEENKPIEYIQETLEIEPKEKKEEVQEEIITEKSSNMRYILTTPYFYYGIKDNMLYIQSIRTKGKDEEEIQINPDQLKAFIANLKELKGCL